MASPIRPPTLRLAKHREMPCLLAPGVLLCLFHLWNAPLPKRLLRAGRQTGGVLIRALEPVKGLDVTAQLRASPHLTKPNLLTSGPGRLCQALGVTRATHNGLDMTLADSFLQILDDGFRPNLVIATSRIGITEAVEEPLRFRRGRREVSKNDEESRYASPYRYPRISGKASRQSQGGFSLVESLLLYASIEARGEKDPLMRAGRGLSSGNDSKYLLRRTSPSLSVYICISNSRGCEAS